MKDWGNGRWPFPFRPMAFFAAFTELKPLIVSPNGWKCGANIGYVGGLHKHFYHFFNHKPQKRHYFRLITPI